jgi:hypothetical protein
MNTLLCSGHNRFLADQDYGAEQMARAVTEARGAITAHAERIEPSLGL